MEPSQMEKRLSELNQSQRTKIHSLFRVPFLRRSEPQVDDNMMETRNLDSISQASSTRLFSSKTDPSRDGNKEGTGRKLLNMLRKTLKGSESKELEAVQDMPALVPFGDVVGCLAVHIKRCRHFSSRINLQYYSNVFIRITVNKIMKYTKAHSLNWKNNERRPGIMFEEVKYFSVQVPRRQDDGRNMIYLELMKFGHLEAYPIVLGSFSLHLYEIIQKGCFTEEFFMKIRNLVVCKVEVEFMFSYGNFGYGFSHQLKPLQKLIQPSMFMHVPPPVERTDPLTNVITPQLIEYPAFLSPDLNVTVGTQQKQTHPSSPVRLEKLQQQPRDRLDRMKKEYRNLKTWEEKSKYLDQILRMKTEVKENTDCSDTDGSDTLFMKHDSPPLSSFSQSSELSLKKQDQPLPCEFPVKTLEVKKNPSLIEMKQESPDSSLILQDAETKKESLPSEERTPLPSFSSREKDISAEYIDGRNDELVCENTGSKEETAERWISDSASPEVKPIQSYKNLGKISLIHSETKLKSIILSPFKKKKSTDEIELEKRQTFENKKSSELLQELKEDIEAVAKMHLSRHVSFNILQEAAELPSTATLLTEDTFEEYSSSLDETIITQEEEENYKERVGEKDEDSEDSDYRGRQGMWTWKST
ncbi:cation channel sperm-associated targeting subunit tau-like [Antechinus flavipes]|uniref:cation channel sperm-associated targeting subunit tau-like n=1 Tax=Antechinus flavipes TaxID=38775 RepID=UPI002236B2C7|nr:cation channel sperm-associated targeting subunit tau-like [Antechinus flavipes]